MAIKETRQTVVNDLLFYMKEHDYVGLYNEALGNNNKGKITLMDFFNFRLETYTPITIAKMIQKGSFDYTHEYFRITDDDRLVSSNMAKSLGNKGEMVVKYAAMEYNELPLKLRDYLIGFSNIHEEEWNELPVR